VTESTVGLTIAQAMPRSWFALLALAAVCGCAPSFPEGVTGQVVTEDTRSGVPCRLRLWRGAIRPIDGTGEALAEASVTSGRPFEAALRPTGAPDPGAGLLWLTVECEGYFVKVRGIEWSGARTLLPAVDVGQVWVPKRKGS
jgi:hypothetical protein